MYLKRLEIKGFKSFADQTELNLEAGLNIIVGPNGCGKSNIVDAIRWVLGEANVRHLRGHRNEDVIFNGTDKKRALGLAHVEMTVDNLDRNIPLDYAEVTVSRKIYRSGESEFYINRTRVRMKDVVKLYTDTGLGKSGYSIISQGELERVLNGQPLDRRLMLEEAAGIIKYRQQRDEVQQRISATSHDLVRAEDILGELGNREYELQAKADKAKNYLVLRDRQLILDKEVLGFQIQENYKQQQQRDEELQKMLSDLQTLRFQANSVQESVQRLEAEAADKTTRWQELKDEKASLDTALSRTNGEIRLAQERIKNYGERIQTAAADRLKYKQLLDKLGADLSEKHLDLGQEEENYELRLADWQQLSQDIKDLESASGELDRAFNDQTSQSFNRANQEATLKNEIAALETKSRQFLEKKERWRVRIDEMVANLAASEQRITELQEQKAILVNQQQEIQGIILREEKLIAQKRAAGALAGQLHASVRQEAAVLEHRLQAISDWQKSYSGYSEGVRAILTSPAGQALSGMIGVVTDLIDIPDEIETAITTALGRSYENIVVRSAADAAQAIALLKQRQWGRATFLPLDSLRANPIPDQVKRELKAVAGVVGIAAELIGHDREYALAVEHLLGRVVIVDNLATGWNIFRKIKYPVRIVTRDGEVINFSGAVTGGMASSKPSGHPLANKQEIGRVRRQLEELNQSASNHQTKAQQISQELNSLENNLQTVRNSLDQAAFRFDMIKQEINRLIDVTETMNLDIARLEQETGQFDTFVQQSAQQIISLKEQVMENQAQDLIDDQEIEQTKLKLENCRRELAIKQERYQSNAEQLAMKKKEIDSLNQNIRQFEKVQESYCQSAVEAEDLQRKLNGAVGQQTTLVNAMITAAEQQQQRMQLLTAGVEAIGAEIQALSQKAVALNEGLAPLQIKLEIGQEKTRNIELKQVRLETELEGLVQQWQDKFHDEDPALYQVEASLRQIREYRLNLEELREQLEKLGPVDIEAIKEYDDVKARYEFLRRQIADLSAAKVSLQNLLEETEQIMTRNFIQFIGLAEASFQKTFREIFNGGDASLCLDSTNDLNSGVDLTVKMPGKRNQSLNLLSGGERALTCIAFIFALLRLKPAPFCLLDEIDASLDETNLIRFTDFLRSMANDTQFIVVTHRQATIEAGNNIYGITMPEEGISSVLSIRSEQMESLAV